MQKDLFLASEGDAYFRRNLGRQSPEDPVLDGMRYLAIKPVTVAEIGCSSGERLAMIANLLPTATCYGFDPSSEAIAKARSERPGDHFAVGTADQIGLPDASIDLLIFGFCLYLTDPADHFRIASEADRVLRDGGFMCVFDFMPRTPHKNPYAHVAGLHSHKMEFSRMFNWHPSYRLLHRINGEVTRGHTRVDEETWACDFLLKDAGGAFPIGSRS